MPTPATKHAALGLALLLASPSVLAAAYAPSAIVLTAFPPELRTWQIAKHYPVRIRVPGLKAPLACNARHVCVAITGEGEINAALSVTSLVRDPALAVGHTLFIRSGIAGGVDAHEALGSVYVANDIVAWAFGHHYLSRQRRLAWAPSNPPFSGNHWETLSYRIAPALLARALRAAHSARLANSRAVIRLDRAMGLATTPSVRVGANVSGDDFWIGRQNERIARQITAYYTHGRARYASTAMEDLGDIAALHAFGLKDHYLSVRAVSDIDVPPPATTVHAIIDKGDEYAGALAATNAMRVTKAIIARLAPLP